MDALWNKQQLRYIVDDAKLGLQRNKGSVLASVALLLIALTLIGSLLLTRAYLSDALDYVESQLAMKVYVEDGLAQDVADILARQTYTEDVTIETGQQMLEQIAFFFNGKEHMLESFTDGSVPDAVKFTVHDASYMETISEQLGDVNGIVQVVYPQQMAQLIDEALTTVERLSVATVIVFFALAFGIVYVTFHLAMYQREKELRVKLFLGMDPRVVRLQFLVEGSIIGVIGSLIAIVLTVVLYNVVFVQLQQAMPYLGSVAGSDVAVICGIQLVSGVVISLLASYMSTRVMIANG